MADEDATNIVFICISFFIGGLVFGGAVLASRALNLKQTVPGAVVGSLLSTAWISNQLTKSLYCKD